MPTYAAESTYAAAPNYEPALNHAAAPTHAVVPNYAVAPTAQDQGDSADKNTAYKLQQSEADNSSNKKIAHMLQQDIVLVEHDLVQNRLRRLELPELRYADPVGSDKLYIVDGYSIGVGHPLVE